MYPLVTAAALSLTPAPSDVALAYHDLTSPVGHPPAADQSPRARIAALVALHHLGGLDADAPDYRWFGAQIGWESEVDHGRRVVVAARDAPADDWLPPPAWFAGMSVAYSAAADRWRRRATEYRERAEWECDRAERLHHHAREMDSEADRLADLACRLARWSGSSWACPRRVMLAEVREWIGRDAYDRREWPE